jgi:hypothetical protein
MNTKKYNEYMRNYQHKRKEAEVKKGGGKCHCCGERKIEFLGVSKKDGKVTCHNCREYMAVHHGKCPEVDDRLIINIEK